MIIIIITLCGAGGLCGFGNYGGMICYIMTIVLQ